MASTVEEKLAPASTRGVVRGWFTLQRSGFLRWFAILLVVWAFSAVYEGTHLKRGFVPWDAGAYAESAVRVLHGQLPHRDFVEVYTGGLTYLNAAAMRAFGETLAAERMMMFAFFLAWIPALYWVFSQFCRDWKAGALVLLAVAWSVPNYSEAVPSWYNLIFATFGIAALLAYIKRPAWKWLLLAGMCGGFSFLAKSVGLCYVAGVLSFFLFREQVLAARAAECRVTESGLPVQIRGTHEPRKLGRTDALHEQKPAAEPPRFATPMYTIFVFAALAIFLALLVHVIAPLIGKGAGEFVLFVLPEAALCVGLAWMECTIQARAGRRSFRRFSDLFRMAIPFGIGVIVPILIFLVPYIGAHAIGTLAHDLLAQASVRIAAAHKAPYEIVTIIPAIAIAGAAILSAWLDGRARWIFVLCFTGLFIAGIVLAFDMHFSGGAAYLAVWSAAYWLVPVLVIAGVGEAICAARRNAVQSYATGRLARGRNSSSTMAAPDGPGAFGTGDVARRNLAAQQPLFLLTAVTALCNLVEFPYSAPVYFCYIAPLVILCAAALVRPFPRISREMLAAMVAGFFIFMVFAATPGFIYALGFERKPDVEKYAIQSTRAGGLRVDPQSTAVYNVLIPLVREHAGTGDIYAAPDCPEVYFLSGYRNLTPDVYDFLRPESRNTRAILALIANPHIRVVVVNTRPPLSPALPHEVMIAIAREFPQGEMISAFEIRWR